MKPAALLLILSSFSLTQSAPQTDWKPVEQALGRSGKAQPGGVYKFGLPRSDMQVTVAGVQLKPALALGSWLAFKPASDGTMVMGDLVLKEDEVEPVMHKLQQSGFDATALHNHLLHESPRVVYMHIMGHGDAAALAHSLHDAIALTSTPAPSQAQAPAPDLDAAQLNRILRATGTPTGGVLQFSFPRKDTITEHGTEVPPSMGTATAINFQPTGNGRAAIAGDFVLLGPEVNAVAKTLRSGGIEVAAIHSHMVDEMPRLYFMHFWANEDAQKLATTLRSALDQTSSR
jgi:Domain of Unknown Function (DUF1259)